ncbi:glycogen [starch] synthase isoform X2 [Eurytemora carolleeae]|uniref:glycogen [starch] synthase isoform X2 n=1 Tax=Eurytemora carolleeae TaxID=1294199 RepID=UPI000C777E1F|nr:glycogen [starch] synthase isoform X2 [Eurytemora carolleeae]|eukprot:XP_023325707.1 glycogen [starch] synthase-like isoform X2 [Eurytemora affinis]
MNEPGLGLLDKKGVLGYRMETGEDLVKFKENKTTVFPSTAWCLEASWEVVNKQGGIYTVLRSKASISCRELGSRYIMLGPLTNSFAH